MKDSALMTEIEKAYMAGFLDGEGCISIRYDRGGTQLRLAITQTNIEQLDEISNVWGGRLYISPGKVKFSQLSWCGQAALPILKAVLPYLKLKQKQAKLAIFYLEELCNNGCNLTSSQWSCRIEVYRLIKQLNSDTYKYGRNGQRKTEVGIDS